jgi:uncharacterized membrane protein YeaQ/YmgE (transglycosylase-associated protein family)
VSLLVWIGVGFVAGFIASKMINQTGNGLVLDSVLGIVGAVVTGWLFNTFGMNDVSGMNAYSFLVAAVGAMAVLVVYHLLVRPVTIPG